MKSSLSFVVAFMLIKFVMVGQNRPKKVARLRVDEAKQPIGLLVQGFCLEGLLG